MANDGRPVRLGDPWAPPEPTLAQIMDPLALEERLKEARARRAAVLAARGPRPDRPLPPDFLAAPPAAGPRPPVLEDLHPPRAGEVLEPEAAAELPTPAPEALASPAARVVPHRLPPAPPPVAYAPPVETPVVPDPTPVAAPVVVDPLTPAESAEPAGSRRLAGAPVWLTFVAGIGLGAAAVAFAILPPASRQPSAEAPAPVAVVESPPPETPAPAAAAVEPPPVEVVASLPPPVAGPPPAPAAAGSVAAPPTPAAVATEPLAPAAAPVELAVPAADNSTPPVDALATARLALPVEPLAAPPADMPTAAIAPAPEADAPAPPTTALPARVTIHYPPSGEAAAFAARDALVAAGVGDVDILPVSFAIQRTNVRFYHAADADAAGTVTGLLAPDPSGEPPLPRDFTGYATPPVPGKLEVWVAGAPAEGSRSAAPAAQRPVASTPRAAPTAPTPAPAAPTQAPVFVPPPLPQDQAQAVARILVERAYERLLEQIPAR